MIPNSQPLRKQTIERMLNSLMKNLEDDTSLTNWEREFVDSANTQFAFRGDLSDRQCEILERIYDK